ncbi:MAG: hypothetical protein IJH76_05640 [Clostridia bacterium]|nr:hypothetical protein [Clostridia bacterium]
MKRIILCLIIGIIIILVPNSYAVNEETLNEQQESFGINSFIKNAKQYVNEDFLEEGDINNIFEEAIKGKVDNGTFLSKLLKIFGKEVKSTLVTISSIIVIILVHSILKSISEGLENESIATIIYYVQYILIATIIFGNFAQIIQMVKESATNMVGFINILIPLLSSLMLFTRKYNNNKHVTTNFNIWS